MRARTLHILIRVQNCTDVYDALHEMELTRVISAHLPISQYDRGRACNWSTPKSDTAFVALVHQSHRRTTKHVQRCCDAHQCEKLWPPTRRIHDHNHQLPHHPCQTPWIVTTCIQYMPRSLTTSPPYRRIPRPCWHSKQCVPHIRPSMPIGRCPYTSHSTM